MPTFEEQMNELEQVVARLEDGGLPLEESVTLFESGMRLSAACKAQLASAESRIQVLLEPDRGGQVRTEFLQVDVEDADDEALDAEDE